MKDQYYVGGVIPERFVEVDAARLLLILARFARGSEELPAHLRCLPVYPFVRYFTPEYYLHKLDFLLRYPRYFIYELTELFRLGVIADQPAGARQVRKPMILFIGDGHGAGRIADRERQRKDVRTSTGSELGGGDDEVEVVDRGARIADLDQPGEPA